MWRGLKNISTISKHVPSAVDEAYGGTEIPELFVHRCEKLYNSVPTILEELDTIRADINSKCVRKLKAGKRDGGHG